MFKRRSRREDYIRYIEAYIERGNEWIRAAFYSDPEVETILETLYERWSKGNHVGEPIDYATDEEIETLYRLARHYASLTPYEAYSIYMKRLEERGEERKD